jgi:hypothetical protein
MGLERATKMFGNSLLSSHVTRLREGNNQSTYRNITLAPNVREEVRIAHSTAGSTSDGNKLTRHLISYEVEVSPSATNLLQKSEKVTVNFTITNSSGVPLTGGTGDLVHLNMDHIILNMGKLVFNTGIATVNGELPLASVINGEI